MDNSKRKKIIVVLGAGRSGTSILMQILEALGMGTSPSMIAAKEHNPMGPYEDSDIFSIQERLQAKTTPASMAPPLEWLNSEATRTAKTQLKTILESRVQDVSTVFGYKDPRTALFIPMWTQIFNELAISPLYILATRKPATVINSMLRQWNSNESITELFWLTKNVEALYQTGGNCFIVHYEDWFTERAPEIAEQLLKYTGLDEFSANSNLVTDALAPVIKPKLNRSTYGNYQVKNRYVYKLQEQLEQCRGDQFDRDGLRNVVMECRKAMDEFSGWALEAQRLFKPSVNYNLGKVGSNDLTKDLEKFVLSANLCLQKCKDLEDDIENHRIKYSSLETTANGIRKKLKRKDVKIHSLQTSPTFQIGQIIVKAITKPGKNTLFAPFYLLRVLLATRISNK